MVKIILIIFFITFTTFAFAKKSSDSELSPTDPNLLWVGKSNEAKSCQTEKGVDIDIMAKELSNAGIKVYTRKIFPLSVMQLQSCGADKGDLNGYLISKSELEKSIQLGFKLIKIETK